MTNRYKLVSLDEAAPGMVLSDDLLDAHGNVLLPRDATVTAAILASLRRHHVDVIPISLGELSDAERQAAQQHHRDRLVSLFRQAGDSQSSELLFQYVSEFRLGEGL